MKQQVLPSKKPISIQGEIGSYSHIAVNSIFGEGSFLNFRKSFDEVFKDLDDKVSDFAIIPIENSTYGSIYQNYDNLTKHEAKIIGEIYLKINFHLIANPGAKIENIKKIYSHPVGLGQIKKFLKQYPHIEAIEHSDTAGAVKMISELEGDEKFEVAAAASNFAAQVYGMEIIAENIHENPKNYTRFYVVTLDAAPSPRGEGRGEVILPESLTSEKSKTTIQFVLGEEPGSLYKSLRAFADRNISLTKIESRPVINTEWEYRFYVDIMAGEQDENLQSSVNEMIGYVKNMKVLGSYAKGEYIDT